MDIKCSICKELIATVAKGKEVAKQFQYLCATCHEAEMTKKIQCVTCNKWDLRSTIPGFGLMCTTCGKRVSSERRKLFQNNQIKLRTLIAAAITGVLTWLFLVGLLLVYLLQ